jgi:hypothetical protein
MRSIEKFMPCDGKIHIVIDRQDMLAASAWINLDDASIRLHALDVPPELAFPPGYQAQAWVMMWADTFVRLDNDSTADFIMFMDTDGPLGLPVTCRSLFNEDGKLYLAGWDLHSTQPQFVKCVEDMVGPGRTSYMSFFPFIMPISAFGRMRARIAHRLNATDFNHALVMWSDLPGVDVRGGGMNGAVRSYGDVHGDVRERHGACIYMSVSGKPPWLGMLSMGTTGHTPWMAPLCVFGGLYRGCSPSP